MASVGRFITYLRNHGIEIINTNDHKDHTIDLYNPDNKRTAFIVSDFSGTMDWFTIMRVCSRLVVPLPDKNEIN